MQDVRGWSDARGLTARWLFLTGSATLLKTVWKAYGIDAEVEPNGDVTHTPAVYLVDRRGRERWLLLSGNDARGLTAEADVVARHIAALLT